MSMFGLNFVFVIYMYLDIVNWKVRNENFGKIMFLLVVVMLVSIRLNLRIS